MTSKITIYIFISIKTYLGIKKCLPETELNLHYDQTISLQTYDEKLYSKELAFFDVFEHHEGIWLDLEMDYQDFEVV